MWGVLNVRENLLLMDERGRGMRCLGRENHSRLEAKGNSQACACINPSVTNGEASPGEERLMKSKACLGTFLGSAFFLFFLIAAIPALAQSTVDVNSSQPEQPATADDLKPAAS